MLGDMRNIRSQFAVIRHLSLVIPSCFVIRHSSFSLHHPSLDAPKFCRLCDLLRAVGSEQGRSRKTFLSLYLRLADSACRNN